MASLGRRGLGACVGACLGLAVASWACERPRAGAESLGLGERGETRRLATATAFDLAATPRGAVLAWAPFGGDTLRVTRFGTDGNPVGGAGATALVPGVGGGAADMSVAAAASGVALAWRDVAPRAAMLRAAWVPSEGSARRFELGPVWRGGASSRGALALVARDDEALLLARGLGVRCTGARDESCFSFQFFELGPDEALATGLSLSVPRPCAAHSAQLISARRSSPGEARGPFEYAICAGAPGATALTVFSIQPSPAYAAAEEALQGCEPLGAGRFGGEATFVAVCGGERRSVSVPVGGGALVARRLDSRGLICKAGGALLRFGDDWLRASEPLGRLELLLNEDLAPKGARAVWTGNALLVAREHRGELALERYVCRSSGSTGLEGPLDAGL